MCRHLAYVGAPIRMGELLTDPPFSLVRQSWAPRRQQHGVVNADGFGVGWYPSPDPAGPVEPARHRGAGPVWADETFGELARVITTPALLAAVRSATPGMVGGQSAAAAAPFRRGRWLFSHNGALPGWPDGASRLGWGLDAGVLATLDAPTDSALLWAITVGLLARGKTAAAALTEVIARVEEAGGGRATLLLTDGQAITATAWGTSLCWRRLPGGVVVASEPYDDDPGWVDVPDGSLLIADAAGTAVEPVPAGARPTFTDRSGVDA
ncbi:ergothioneine biosynthesis protein EgtC [Nakamurella sp.]|uniref:ergothioneine biosynthesis protein EgtC n=1 Tax=Nakamurella sp. TaxID=1869182 RepID=UPI003B3A69BE